MTMGRTIDQLVQLEVSRTTLEAAAHQRGLRPEAIAEITEDDFVQRFIDAQQPALTFLERLVTARPELLPVEHDPADLDKAREQFRTLKGRGEYLAAHGQQQYDETLKAVGGTVGSLKIPDAPLDNSKGSGGGKKKSSGRVTNPWSPDFKGDALAERVRIIKQSTKLAVSLAKSAGMRLDGQPLAS
jgi:hypothetical protein